MIRFLLLLAEQSILIRNSCETTVRSCKWEHALIFILHCDYLLFIFEGFLSFSLLFNWESYLFYSEQYFNFQILSWHYFWFILLCLFALVLLNIISVCVFFFSVPAGNHSNYEILVFLLSLLASHSNSQENLSWTWKKMGILWDKFLLILLFSCMITLGLQWWVHEQQQNSTNQMKLPVAARTMKWWQSIFFLAVFQNNLVSRTLQHVSRMTHWKSVIEWDRSLKMSRHCMA